MKKLTKQHSPHTPAVCVCVTFHGMVYTSKTGDNSKNNLCKQMYRSGVLTYFEIYASIKSTHETLQYACMCSSQLKNDYIHFE